MNPASRTPEGTPNRCPVCGKWASIEPSSYPTHDAPCPHCGHLLCFAGSSADSTADRARPVRPRRRIPTHEHQDEPFTAFERAIWAALAIVSTLLVALNDGLVFTTALWLLGTVFLGQVALPWLFRRSRDLVAHVESFYRGVALCWALVPGPILGVIFGVLMSIGDSDLPSLTGGMIGLILGPTFAAAEGIVITSIIDLVTWIVTGKSLSKHAI